MHLSRERMRTIGVGVLGIAVLIAFWWLAATTFLAGHQIPTPVDVIDKFHERGFAYYRKVFSVTLQEAAKGYVYAMAIALAAISVIFTTVVGAVLGFRSADQTSLDVVQVYGGSRLQQFTRVRLIASLPALFTTLQIAAPAAFLGALLGEYFDKHLVIGVGPSLYLAQNNRETALVWTLGFGCAIVSGIAYFAIGLMGRAITPWAKGTP